MQIDDAEDELDLEKIWNPYESYGMTHNLYSHCRVVDIIGNNSEASI